ncbi:hypothetical protein PENNAL_c0023G08899 [Penicillium nalgiovense]|uniref:Uncharacterized protein n=1 Tax=Penicillium nalgiovense TaxID=60175 RepID=A0A1V6YEU2_PENNA|nr:hypothetical protein PENNAL_c0023G08899 [Penicillium nalgiovense]
MAESDSQPVFSPVCPIPLVVQPAERIQQLKDYLPTEFGQVQRVNVEALIRMYESGELGPRRHGDPPVYLVEGKRVDKDPWQDESVPNNTMKWCELPHMAQSVSDSFRFSALYGMQQLHARMRIPLQYGGDPALTRLFLVCNDTGSDVLTVFRSDLAMLQFDPARHGGALEGAQLLDTPIGSAPQTFVQVEMQVLTSSLVDLHPGQMVRQYLFFGTAPGNDRLYVAQEKAGLIRDMPA